LHPRIIALGNKNGSELDQQQTESIKRRFNAVFKAEIHSPLKQRIIRVKNHGIFLLDKLIYEKQRERTTKKCLKF